MGIIQELVKRKIIDKSKVASLEAEAKNSGLTEEEVLLEKRIVTEDFLFGVKSEIVKTALKYASPDDIPLKVLEIIPEESAKHYKMIPLKIDKNITEIGMVYPEDLKAREALEFLSRQSKFNYKVFLITLTNFEEILRKYRSLKKEATVALEELETELQKKEFKTAPAKKTDIEKIVEEAPISKLVAVILRHAVDGGASDIHIEPTTENVRVRFRLDGVLHSSLILPLETLPTVVARIKILCNLKIDETRIPQDGRFSTKIDEKEVDFRVSTFPTILGEKVAIRILDPTKRKTSFESLGVTGRNLKVIEAALEKSYGMILVTGPTGAGKTTTLYAILELLSKEELNVVTLEDPVEYFMPGVNQSQVNSDIGYTFASGLRQIVRQDPDIIMVGEIRDEETASLAIHAALTGHIVLSTLHTSNTIGALPRLVDMGVQPFLIPPTISIIIAQRLIRTLCEKCKRKVEPKSELRKIILKEIEQMPPAIKKDIKISESFTFYEPVGCARCNKTGYSGRIGVFEILEMTKELEEIVLKEPSERKISEEAFRQGMLTMKQDGILKVLQGITSFEEVIRTTESK
jgi:type IV pilus assembly protein PilB